MNWESILNVITHPIVQTVVGAVAALAIKKWADYKAIYKEINDISRAVLGARSEKSEGGKKITEGEYAVIGKEVVDLIQAGVPLLAKKKTA
jgi:hypothetical protein